MKVNIEIKYEDLTWNLKPIPDDEDIRNDMLVQGSKRAIENLEEGYISGELFYHFENDETVSGWWHRKDENENNKTKKRY